MLIAWGHFARTLGLTKCLAVLPLDQKAVVRAPHDKVVEFLIGLLSGIEYLADLSAGPAPLAQDDEVAIAWQERSPLWVGTAGRCEWRQPDVGRLRCDKRSGIERCLGRHRPAVSGASGQRLATA
jgi:hypothetical protein